MKFFLIAYPGFLMAGSSTKKDPLLEIVDVNNKALIPLGNRPMVSYVIEAMDKAETIDRILVIGIKKDHIKYVSKTPIEFIDLDEPQNRVETIIQGMKHFAKTYDTKQQVIFFACDTPFITGAIVDDCINRMEINETNKDVYFGIIHKNVFDKMYPNAMKNYRQLKEGTVAGGDIHAVRIETLLRNEETIHKILMNRKSMFKLIITFSPLFIIRYLIGRLSITHITEFFLKQVGVEVICYEIKYPQAGMDLDYPEQYERFKILIN